MGNLFTLSDKMSFEVSRISGRPMSLKDADGVPPSSTDDREIRKHREKDMHAT
jgi:hypothetical protein